MIMFQAMAEPILMQWKMHAVRVEMRMLLIGTPNRGDTWDIHSEPGTPRSRAKAKSWRDAPAMFVRLLANMRMIRSEAKPDVLAVDPVAE